MNGDLEKLLRDFDLDEHAHFDYDYDEHAHIESNPRGSEESCINDIDDVDID